MGVEVSTGRVVIDAPFDSEADVTQWARRPARRSVSAVFAAEVTCQT